MMLWVISQVETSGYNSAILPLLSKLYGKKPSQPIKDKDLQSVVSPELAKSVAETTSENGIIKEKLCKLSVELGQNFLPQSYRYSKKFSSQPGGSVSDKWINHWPVHEWWMV